MQKNRASILEIGKRKFPKQLAGLRVINTSGGNRIIEGTKPLLDFLVLNRCNPLRFFGAPTNSAQSTETLYPWPAVACILSARGDANVSPSAVKSIPIDVIDVHSTGRIEQKSVEVNVSVIGPTADPTAGIPSPAAPHNGPGERQDEIGIRRVDHCVHTPTQGDKRCIVWVRHLMASLQAFEVRRGPGHSRVAGLFAASIIPTSVVR